MFALLANPLKKKFAKALEVEEDMYEDVPSDEQ